MSFAQLLNCERTNALKTANKPFDDRFATAIVNFTNEIVNKIPELKTEFIEKVRTNLNSLETSINVPMNVKFDNLLMPGDTYYVHLRCECYIATRDTQVSPHIINYLDFHCEELQRLKNFLRTEFSGCTVNLISEKNELKIHIAYRVQHT